VGYSCWRNSSGDYPWGTALGPTFGHPLVEPTWETPMGEHIEGPTRWTMLRVTALGDQACGHPLAEPRDGHPFGDTSWATPSWDPHWGNPLGGSPWGTRVQVPVGGIPLWAPWGTTLGAPTGVPTGNARCETPIGDSPCGTA
jgi:hypothetical protein